MSQNHYLLIVSLFIFYACDTRTDAEIQAELIQSISSIITTYVSHQADTKQKDQNTIAKVWFHPDGTIKEFTQYMTYPYDFPDPTSVTFWNDSVNKPLVHLIMDGLELGMAERNFLYGNDWPADYATWVQKSGHPRHPKAIEGIKNTVQVLGGVLPSALEVKLDFSENWEEEYPFSGLNEMFEYENGKIVSFKEQSTYNENSVHYKMMKEKGYGLSSVSETTFEYGDSGLTRVLHPDDRDYRFLYENGRMVRSEFYKRDKRYNYRVYFYSPEGLKEKTEMYNVDNELEYTITYSYEYF